MQITYLKTDGKAQTTGMLMHQMVDKYYTDMSPYASFTIGEVFDIIKSLPYRNDPSTVEVLMRPLYTMKRQGWGGDCDDKAIALASYAKLLGIPHKFVAVAKNKKNLIHVYTLLYINSAWIPADPTYKFNILGTNLVNYSYTVVI